MKTLGKIGEVIDEFREMTDWADPDDEVIKKFQDSLRPLLKHRFNPVAYKLAEQFVKRTAPAFFKIPRKDDILNSYDWGKTVSGIENIQQYLNDPEKKLIFYLGPHNTHLDEFIVATAFYNTLIGNILIGARDNLYMVKGGEFLKRMGSWAISFFESMPRKMEHAAFEVIKQYKEEILLPQANTLSVWTGKSGMHPFQFASDGRSRDGLIRLNTGRSIDGYLENQAEHLEWEIFATPITETLLMVPEQKIFSFIDELKNSNPEEYIRKDYGSILEEFKGRMIDYIKNVSDEGFFKNDPITPKSDFHIDIQEPISLKDNDYIKNYSNLDDRERNILKKKVKRELARQLEDTIANNYRPLPEKLLAYTILDVTPDALEGGSLQVEQLTNAAMVKRILLKQSGRNLTNIEGNMGYIIDDAVKSLQDWKVLEEIDGKMYIKEPEIIKYQANTIDHLFK